VFVSSGSAKDDAFAETHGPAKATVQVLAPVNAAWFSAAHLAGPAPGPRVKHRGSPAYAAAKARWKAKLLELLYKEHPLTRGRVAFADLATPLTTNFYLGTERGETYGLAHSLARFSPEAQAALHTDVQGVARLHLVGQDAFAVGVASVLTSGFLTASRLSPRALAATVLEMVLG
jgi:all-trans-retinol 13,14-reductase